MDEEQCDGCGRTFGLYELTTCEPCASTVCGDCFEDLHTECIDEDL